MNTITKAELDTIARTITSTHGIRKEQNFGVQIGVYLPYRKVASRIVATVGTYEDAKVLAKAIKREYEGKIDFAVLVYMPAIRGARRNNLAMQK